MVKPLRIALTKGRLEKDTVGLLEKLGYQLSDIRAGNLKDLNVRMEIWKLSWQRPMTLSLM